MTEANPGRSPGIQSLLELVRVQPDPPNHLGGRGRIKGPVPASWQPRSAPPSHPPAEEKFDAAEIMEDFEHPICQICMGAGMVRDENGINMVTAPAPG